MMICFPQRHHYTLWFKISSWFVAWFQRYLGFCVHNWWKSAPLEADSPKWMAQNRQYLWNQDSDLFETSKLNVEWCCWGKNIIIPIKKCFLNNVAKNSWTLEKLILTNSMTLFLYCLSIFSSLPPTMSFAKKPIYKA